jgi:hypothetical protein
LIAIAMEPKSIVSEICSTADEFLAGVTKRDEARAGIAEWLTIHHLKLPHDEKKLIIREVMSNLEKEKFFETDPGGED